MSSFPLLNWVILIQAHIKVQTRRTRQWTEITGITTTAALSSDMAFGVCVGIGVGVGAGVGEVEASGVGVGVGMPQSAGDIIGISF